MDNQLRNYLFLSFIVLLIVSCSSQDCSELVDENYTSYKQAKRSIKSASFTFYDQCNTSKSSWILGAEYYSCDNEKGYFFIETKKLTYIHKDLPKEIWKKFKEANSFGRFYNSRIKGHYQLVI